MKFYITAASKPGTICLDRVMDYSELYWRNGTIKFGPFSHITKDGYIYFLEEQCMNFSEQMIGEVLTDEKPISKDRIYNCTFEAQNGLIRLYHSFTEKVIELQTKEGSIILSLDTAHALGRTLSSMAYHLKDSE